MPDDNYRNLLKEAKHQRDLLKDCFNHVGALARQEDRILDGSYHWDRRSWHLSVLFRTTQLFQELLFEQVLLPTNFSQKNQYISKRFQSYFQPNHKYLKTSSAKMSHIDTRNFFNLKRHIFKISFSGKFAR